MVLNWNGADLLPACLDSLLKQDYPDFFVLIVDNASTDNSRQILEQYQADNPKKIRTILSNRNTGFAGGVNIGIKYATAESAGAVALFNNDAVAKPNWLTILAATLRNDPHIGIATGLLLHADGQTIDSSGDYYSIWGLAFPRSRDEATERAPESGYVFGATGGASLYRANLFEEVGLFDENFFAYYEDVDISFRAQLAGWKVYYNRDAVALHKRGATSDKLPGFAKYQMFKNLPQLFWKNVPSGLLLKIGLRFKFVYLLMFVNAVAQKNGWPALKGLGAGVWYGAAALVKRADIQKLKKVSAGYIDSMLYQDLPPSQKGRLRQLVGRASAFNATTANEEPVERPER